MQRGATYTVIKTLMDISFLTGTLGATGCNVTMRLGALVDGKTLEREISENTLRRHFGARSGLQADLMSALEVGRDRIQAVARVRIAQGKTEKCFIDVDDF